MSLRVVDESYHSQKAVRDANLVQGATDLIRKLDGGVTLRDLVKGPRPNTAYNSGGGVDTYNSNEAFQAWEESLIGNDPYAAPDIYSAPTPDPYSGVHTGIAGYNMPEPPPMDLSGDYSRFAESGGDGVGMTNYASPHHSFPIADGLENIPSMSEAGSKWLSSVPYRRGMRFDTALTEGMTPTNKAEEMYHHLKRWVKEKRIPPTRITPEDLMEYLKMWDLAEAKVKPVMEKVGMRSEMAVETQQIDNLLLEVASDYDALRVEAGEQVSEMSGDPVDRFMAYFRRLTPGDQNRAAKAISKFFRRGDSK